MPGIRIVTNLDRDQVIKIAKDVCRDLGFAVKSQREGEFSLTKGSAVLGILAAPVSPRCSFSLLVEAGRDQTVEVILDRNTPWWGGIVAVNQVQKRAEELIDTLAKHIEGDGGKILKRTVF